MVLYNFKKEKKYILPKAPWETEDDAHVPAPTLRSRRFATKVMFMGIVAPPVKNKMNGKIFIKRVSEKKLPARLLTT